MTPLGSGRPDLSAMIQQARGERGEQDADFLRQAA